MRIPNRLLGCRGATRVLPLLLVSLLGLHLWMPAPLQAQLSDQDTTSTRGTQFVRPPPKKQTPPPSPPPNLPVNAALQAPPEKKLPPPPPPQPPPRFPSVVFLIDTSDSMLNRTKDSKSTRIKEAKDALIRVLRDMSPDTRVQLWTFDRSMKAVQVPGVPQGRFIPIGARNHREMLIGRVKGLRTSGGTNLFKSVVQALAIFDDRRDQALYRSGQRFPVLVVVSDGEDGGKTLETMETVQKEKARRPLVTVNTIGFSISKQDGWFKELCRIATRRQGCATAGDAAELKRMLESFHQYQGKR